MSKIQVQAMKAKAMKILTFAVRDYLIDMVTKYKDLIDAWKVLKKNIKV